MPYLFLFSNRATAKKIIKRSWKIAFQMDGMKAQSTWSKGTGMRVKLKNDINNYVYTYSICIDADYGFIRHFVITPANNHDGYVWANPAYSGRRFKDLLSLL